MVEYIEYRDGKMFELRCMRGDCQNVLGRQKEGGKFVHWSSYKVFQVCLSDGSRQDMLVCPDCQSKCTDTDFDSFDKARRYGWTQELVHKKGLTVQDAERTINEGAMNKTIVKRWGA